MRLGAVARGVAAAVRIPGRLDGAGLSALTAAIPGAVDRDVVAAASVDAARRTLRLLARIPGGRWRATCLYLSAVEVVLRRDAGEDARLVLGARRDGEGIGAHAWVESGGIPVGREAANATRFAPFS